MIESEQQASCLQYQQLQMKNTLSNKTICFSGTDKNRLVFNVDDRAHLMVFNEFCNRFISHRVQTVVSAHRRPRNPTEVATQQVRIIIFEVTSLDQTLELQSFSMILDHLIITSTMRSV